MRTYEESCYLLDEIVGRCIRNAEFGESVLADPEAALKEYGLSEDELDDFRALKARHRDEAATGWAAICHGIATIRAQRGNAAEPVTLRFPTIA